MLVRFTLPELSALDALDAEVLVAAVYEDVRPARGVAGLCDWRLGGRISRLMRNGFITGKTGEVVMIPGKPNLPVDKILLVGVGARVEMARARLDVFVATAVDRLTKLRARAAVVELAGRSDGVVSPLEAVDVMLAHTQLSTDLDAWTLVEVPEARAAMEAHLSEQRRRVRRAL